MADSNEGQLLGTIQQACELGETLALVTVIQSGRTVTRFAWTDNGRGNGAPDSPGSPEGVELARSLLTSGRRTGIRELVGSDGSKIVVACEIVRPKHSLLVFGAGHVGQALALIASAVGYQVTVIDDREGFVNRDRFPDTSIALVSAPFETASLDVKITSGTAVVIVTRGHQYDELCLKQTIESNAGYIGMIGSRRRVLGVFERLKVAGVGDELLRRVHAPIGLQIGATSPQEIAVAILAEIIQTFSSPAPIGRVTET
jgi:xanthine dehydrogenase accessory factor